MDHGRSRGRSPTGVPPSDARSLPPRRSETSERPPSCADVVGSVGPQDVDVERRPPAGAPQSSISAPVKPRFLQAASAAEVSRPHLSTPPSVALHRVVWVALNPEREHDSAACSLPRGPTVEELPGFRIRLERRYRNQFPRIRIRNPAPFTRCIAYALANAKARNAGPN